MYIYSIAQLKGGIGKTTSALIIARLLNQKHGAKVLLLEASKQGNIGQFWGHKGNLKLEDVISAPERIKEAICPSPHERLDYISAGLGILKAKGVNEMILRKHLEALGYDYIIIDCEPSFDPVILVLLMVSDKVFLPTSLDKYSLIGVEEMKHQLPNIQQRSGRTALGGVFVTAFQNTKRNREILEHVKAIDGDVMETVIRKSVKVEEMGWRREVVTDFSPRSNASRDYVALVDEILMSESDKVTP